MGWTVHVTETVLYSAQCSDCGWYSEPMDQSDAEVSAEAHRRMHQEVWNRYQDAMEANRAWIGDPIRDAGRYDLSDKAKQ